MRMCIDDLGETIKKKLDKYPVLKRCVEKYINEEDDPCMLTDLTVYVRCMEIDEPEFFGWDEETTEEFYSWGHNSRYANVFEGELAWNFENMVIDILNYLEYNKIEDESKFDPANIEG